MPKMDDSVVLKAPKGRVIAAGSMDSLFVGQRGVVIGIEGTRPKMYRVQFDTPVDVPNFGRVTDDLFASEWIRKVK